MNEINDVWVYLSASPLLHLTLTLIAYQGGVWIYQKSGQLPVFNPVLIAVLSLCGILWVTETPYATYFEGAQFVHFMLGPATVALAIPLYKQFDKVRQSAFALLAAMLLGSICAVGTALGIGWTLGVGETALASLAPKSVTAPIAMAISQELGGLSTLTAVLAVLTGISGAALGASVLKLVRVKDDRARGLALGTISHGIGTARALQMSESAGAFSGLAMGLNGLLSALLFPLVYYLLASMDVIS